MLHPLSCLLNFFESRKKVTSPSCDFLTVHMWKVTRGLFPVPLHQSSSTSFPVSTEVWWFRSWSTLLKESIFQDVTLINFHRSHSYICLLLLLSFTKPRSIKNHQETSKKEFIYTQWKAPRLLRISAQKDGHFIQPMSDTSTLDSQETAEVNSTSAWKLEP